MATTGQATPGRFFVAFIAALIALGPFAIDTYLPAMPAMAEELSTSLVRVNYTLSSYLLGFALGQLIGGPISDQLGRRVVGLAGLGIFIPTALLIAFLDSIDLIIVLRGLQAVGGGFATVICMAMVRDAFDAADAARQFPKIMMVMLTAPLIAPAIGVVLLPLGWESIFIFLMGYAALLAVALYRFPETAAHRTGRLDIPAVFSQYASVLRFRVAGKRISARFVFAQGLLASVLMIAITHSPYIYLEYYGIEPAWFVFYFAANVIAMMLGNFITSRLVGRVEPFVLYVWARGVQFCLAIALVLTVLLTVPPAWLFALLMALVVGSNGVIAPSVQGLYLAPFKTLSGSATSLMNTSVFAFGGIMGAAAGLMYDGTLRPIVLTLLLSLVLGNLVALTIPRTNLFNDQAC